MRELEIMQHAKDYLDQLAQGIDPLTGQEVPEDDVINNVRISRCLFYVSDVLRQVIENGGIQGKPWTAEEDDYLRRAFQAGAEVRELSDALKRTREAIRSRLKKLGLTRE